RDHDRGAVRVDGVDFGRGGAHGGGVQGGLHVASAVALLHLLEGGAGPPGQVGGGEQKFDGLGAEGFVGVDGGGEVSPAAHGAEGFDPRVFGGGEQADACARSEEHTSELQSRENLVCRLL